MATTQIEWTNSALITLDGIFAYIAKDSRVYAQKYIQRLMDSVDRLANFPESGRRVAEAKRDDIREVVFQSYRIIYRIIDAQNIDIIAVVHGRRDLSQAKNQPWAIG